MSLGRRAAARRRASSNKETRKSVPLLAGSCSHFAPVVPVFDVPVIVATVHKQRSRGLIRTS